MKRKGIVALLMAALLCVGALMTGCEEKQISNDNEVLLKWVLLGPGKQKDSDRVWEAFNEKLQSYLPGTQVEFEIIEGANYGERWQLMMASKSDVDIAWSGYAIPSFIGEVDKGAYLELDDLINEYAPDMKKELPEWLFELGKVKEKIYGIPNYQIMSIGPFSVRTKKEYADKYLDSEGVREAFAQWEQDDNAGAAFYAKFEEYMKNLQDNGLLDKGFGVGSMQGFSNTGADDSTTVTGFMIEAGTNKIYYKGTSDERRLWYDTAAEWYKKGYIRNDILSENVDGVNEAQKGYTLWGHSYYDKTSEELETADKGYPVTVLPLGEKYRIKNQIPTTMTCIPATCKNPERAMQLIELMHTEKGKELYNLLVYGLEGEHYKKVSENRIETIGYTSSADSNSPYGLYKWAIGNTSNAYETQVEPEGYAEYVRSLDDNAEILPTVGFKPDISELSVEISQVQAVEKEYKELNYGAHSNYKDIYKEYESKLKSAGVDVIRDELQRQLDEWLKNKQ